MNWQGRGVTSEAGALRGRIGLSFSGDEELMKMATRIRDRAIRRAGELLKQIEPAHGANQNIADGSDSKVFTRTEAAREAGMSERQQIRFSAGIRAASRPS